MKQRHSEFSGRLLAVTLLFIGTTLPLWGQYGLLLHTAIEETQEVEVEDYLYFDLACSAGAWSGYFAPARWNRSSSDTIMALAGEQDDAPSVVFDRSRKETSHWSIEIPAAGYLSFCLRVAPPSGISTVSIAVNDEKTDYQVRSDGLYYSPFLQQGDRFQLSIPADTAVYRWSKLVFHSNFNAVIVRPEREISSERFVPIREGNIQRVFFPSDLPGTWPVFDQDGDRETTEDQIELRSSNDRFEVEYTDNEVLEGDYYALERTFTIREVCSRANWLRRSRRWCPLPLIVDEAGR